MTTATTPFTRPRVIGYVMLSGFAAAAMQMLTTPIEQLDRADIVFMVIDVSIQYGLTGLGVVGIATLGIRGLGAGPQGLLLVLLTTAIAYAHANSGVHLLVQSLSFTRRGWHSFFYDLWHGAFYVSLLMAGCVSAVRTEHTRHLLGQAEIARSRTEAQLGQARLQALRGHLDPVFLLRVMAEVQHRYASDRGAADALLDQLVVFLREAMPAVRSGRSSLAAEVNLAHPYLALRAEIEPAQARCRIVVAPGLDDLPFPPLLLLPLLDQLAAATPAGSRCELRIAARGAGGIALAFTGTPAETGAWCEPALAYRLQVGLQSIHGACVSLRFNEAAAPDAPALAIELRPDAPALPFGREPLDPLPSHPTEELQHG